MKSGIVFLNVDKSPFVDKYPGFINVISLLLEEKASYCLSILKVLAIVCGIKLLIN